MNRERWGGGGDRWRGEEQTKPRPISPSLDQVKKKYVFPLTNNDSSDGEEHKGVSYEESFNVILRDVLHSLHGQQRPGLDPGPDLVEAAPGPLRVLPVALSHGCCLQNCY